jgi:hypothetical protein
MLILYLYLITMIIYFFKYRMEAFFDTPLITIQNFPAEEDDEKD